MGGSCNKQRRQQNPNQMPQVQQFPAPIASQYGAYPAPYGPQFQQQPVAMAPPPSMVPSMGPGPMGPGPLPMGQQCGPVPMSGPVTVLPPIPINYSGGMANCYRPGPPMMPMAQGGQANDRRMMGMEQQEQQEFASRYYSEQMPSGKNRKH